MEIKWHPTEKELRSFAILWLLFFGLLGSWWFWQGSSPWTYQSLGAIALSGGALGLTIPSAMRPIYVAWMCLAFPIGWMISHLLLGTLYFGLLLPTGLLLKAFRADPLQRELDPDATSYWSPRTSANGPERYYRQF